MKSYVDNFTSDIAKAIDLPIIGAVKTDNIKNVLIAGLGGSGIGGTIASQLISDSATVPVIVSKDYSIPAFVNQSTLVVISSYSGNTEETLEALEKAEAANANIICVTSGGNILEQAKAKNYAYIEMPGGYPPRAAFGWSFTQVVKMLIAAGIAKAGLLEDLKSGIDHLNNHAEDVKTQAEALAAELKGKLTVLYSDARFEGIAWRWRQQLNENGKTLCYHHALPEMNHNELVGWRENREYLAVVALRNDNDYYRTQKRFEFTEETARQYAASVHEVWSKGDTDLHRALYLIHFGDYVSVYIAEAKGIDAVEVNIIDKLKGMLADTKE